MMRLLRGSEVCRVEEAFFVESCLLDHPYSEGIYLRSAWKVKSQLRKSLEPEVVNLTVCEIQNQRQP